MLRALNFIRKESFFPLNLQLPDVSRPQLYNHKLQSTNGFETIGKKYPNAGPNKETKSWTEYCAKFVLEKSPGDFLKRI